MLRNTLNTFMTATLIMLLGVSSSAQAIVPAGSKITSTSTLDLADGTSLEKSVTVTVGLKRKAPEVRHLGVRPADGQWIAGAPFLHEYELISRANGEDTYALHVTLDRDASTHLGGTPKFSIRVLNGPVLSDSKIALGATAVLVPAEAEATELIVPNDLTPTDDVVNGISVGDYVFVGNRSKPHRVSAIMSETDTVTLVLSGDGIASAVETGDLIAEGARFLVEVSGDLHSTHEADPAIAVIAVTAEVSGDSADLSETVTAPIIVPILVTLTASVTGPGVLIDCVGNQCSRWFSCGDKNWDQTSLDAVPIAAENIGPLNLCEVSFIPEDVEKVLETRSADGYFVKPIEGCDDSGLAGPRDRYCIIKINENKSVIVVFEKKKFDFVVQPGEGGAIRLAGTDGQITDPEGNTLNGEINCSAQSSCEYTVEHGTQIELTAVPGSGRIHQSWNDCPGEDGPSCTITVTEAATVAATFGVEQIPLTVRIGAGYGIVSSDPEGMSLDLNESETVTQFDKDSTVTLTALAHAGEVPNPDGGLMQRRYRVDGWTGCTQPVGDTCQVTMDAAKTVEVSFVSEKALLTVISGASGTVRSVDVEGIDCASGETCVSEFDQYSLVTLRAEPNDEQDQVEWAGACITCNDGDPYSNENDELCQRLGQNACWTRGIDYPADSNPWVVGSPNYIEGAACYRKCAAPGFQFESTCFGSLWFAHPVADNVRCNAPGNDWRSAGRYTLFILSTGNELLDFNNRYKDRHLCADSNVPQVLDNENNHTCTVLVDKAKIVETRFAESFATQAPRLDISVEGGGVVLMSDPINPINCGGDACGIELGTPPCEDLCSIERELDSETSLLVWPADGYVVEMLDGCDEEKDGSFLTRGLRFCSITENESKSVNVVFEKEKFDFVVQPGEGGAIRFAGTDGQITDPDGGALNGEINCSAQSSCEYTVEHGTQIELTAVPGSGRIHQSWNDCPGEDGPSCTITVTEAATVAATFGVEQIPLTVRIGAGYGTVSSDPEGMSLDWNEPETVTQFDKDSTVTLTALAHAGEVPNPDGGLMQRRYRVDGWTGCTQPVGDTCQVTMDAARTVEVSFVSEKALLTVISGASGTVRSVDVEGIDCAPGETCVSEFDQYSLVTLRAEPNDGYTLSGWRGTCESESHRTCRVRLDQGKTINTDFVKRQLEFFVSSATSGISPKEEVQGGVIKAYDEAGTLLSGESGVDPFAGSPDYNPYYYSSYQADEGSNVTIEAIPEPGFEVHWGACPGSDENLSPDGRKCVVNVELDSFRIWPAPQILILGNPVVNPTAWFHAIRYELTVQAVDSDVIVESDRSREAWEPDGSANPSDEWKTNPACWSEEFAQINNDNGWVKGVISPNAAFSRVTCPEGCQPQRAVNDWLNLRGHHGRASMESIDSNFKDRNSPHRAPVATCGDRAWYVFIEGDVTKILPWRYDPPFPEQICQKGNTCTYRARYGTRFFLRARPVTAKERSSVDSDWSGNCASESWGSPFGKLDEMGYAHCLITIHEDATLSFSGGDGGSNEPDEDGSGDTIENIHWDVFGTAWSVVVAAGEEENPDLNACHCDSDNNFAGFNLTRPAYCPPTLIGWVVGENSYDSNDPDLQNTVRTLATDRVAGRRTYFELSMASMVCV